LSCFYQAFDTQCVLAFFFFPTVLMSTPVYHWRWSEWLYTDRWPGFPHQLATGPTWAGVVQDSFSAIFSFGKVLALECFPPFLFSSTAGWGFSHCSGQLLFDPHFFSQKGYEGEFASSPSNASYVFQHSAFVSSLVLTRGPVLVGTNFLSLCVLGDEVDMFFS